MKIVKARKTKKPLLDLGDVLLGSEYFVRPTPLTKVKHAIWIIEANGWDLLRRAGVQNVDEVLKALTYPCRYLKGNNYLGFLPILFIPQKRQKKYSFVPAHQHDLSLDLGWFKRMVVRDKPFPEPLNAQQAMLGHGYVCSGIGPNDGSADLTWLALKTDTGDEIQGLAWAWYNK